jgi:hypothetical protein
MTATQAGADATFATSLTTIAQLEGDAQGELEHALERLEAGRGLLVRLADLMGGAVGRMSTLSARSLGLAPTLQHKLRGIAETALARAYDVAVIGMRDGATIRPRQDHTIGRVTQVAVVASGAMGGMSGLGGFIPDVGFSTIAIMREIARIAREEGEDLSTLDSRRACLEVFALRGLGSQPDESNLGYFSARSMMRGTPMVMLISEVASRYGLVIGQKFAVQMMPVAGALCGASLNAAFLSHYQELARAHFTVRRLERVHGPKVREVAGLIRERLAARVATT